MNDEKNKPKQSQIEFIPKQGIPLRVLNIKTTAGINLTGIEVLVIVRGGNMQKFQFSGQFSSGRRRNLLKRRAKIAEDTGSLIKV